ncbi:MAG: acyltransferase [Candidatus Lokiarchaeota archaeon]|nr:acyltransferase [Candidatus Lokiarchaeota archaeon]
MFRINYEKTKRLYERFHKKVWALLFSSSFRRFGKTSRILFPMDIQNAKYMEIGENVRILKKVWLAAIKIDEHDPRLIIDNLSRLGNFNHIVSVRNVYIGKKVLTADKVYISDNLHSYEDISEATIDQPTKFHRSVSIGDETWIGENVSIIGANIGKHCVIGANSVVTKDIPDYSIAVGVPAKVIKQYNFHTEKWEKVDSKTFAESDQIMKKGFN